jgi:hypothetical protein
LRRFALGALICVCCLIALAITPAFAKDHASRYQVGTFLSTERLGDGTYSYASCGSFGCSGSAYNASHNVHYVQIPDGLYAINAPVSVAGTFFLGLSTPGGISPTVHKLWFMDDLHDGDKVLLTAKCNQHNLCQFWLPNPDKPGKEFITNGSFHPVVSKTNTTSLCGKGKLLAAVEEQVCNAAIATQAPAAWPGPTSNSVPVSQVPSAPISPNSLSTTQPVQTGLGVVPKQTVSVSSAVPSKPSKLASGGILGVSGANWEQGGVKGVEILEVAPDSPAEIARLHVRDVITDVNGKYVRSIQDLATLLIQYGPGSKITIGYIIKTNLGWMPKDTVVILAKSD